jgi:adenylate kinase
MSLPKEKIHRIVLLGPPGAGKGTQALKIAAFLKIPHISTGEMMRAEVAQKTALGGKVQEFLDTGALVPDNIIIDIIRSRLSKPDCLSGYLLDGFPRTLEQAKQLDVLLESINAKLSSVLDLIVPESVLIDRIKKRGEAGSGRSDDTAEKATKRLQVYWKDTAPVSMYYKETGRVKEIDGLGTIDEVYERIKRNF